MRGLLVVSIVVGCSSSEVPAVTPAAPVAPVSSAGLLRCPLELRAYELGAGTAPSAPAVAGDGFIVAYSKFKDPHYELITRRIDGHGKLGAPIAIVDEAGPYVPVLGSAGGQLLISGNAAGLTTLDAASGAARGSPSGAPWPSDLAIGPRGVVAATHEQDHLVVHRSGMADLRLPMILSDSIPAEPHLASGGAIDVVLTRTEQGEEHSVAVNVIGQPAHTFELFRTYGSEWGEASIAAGRSGFLVVRNAPDMLSLWLYRLDRDGERVGDPVKMPRPDDHHIHRYPRVAALEDGWIVSFWDGIGTSIQRLDPDLQAIGAPLEIRSGDERGGHTDARFAMSATAIAISWTVEAPMMNHGSPDEQPKAPGPRLGVLRCRDVRQASLARR